MSLKLPFGRARQPLQAGLVNRRRDTRRPRFESLEDRSLLSFTPLGPVDAGGPGGYAGVTTADLDNDGHLDLAMPIYGAAAVSVLLGDGQGGFGEPMLFDVGSGPVSVAVGDFNEDGKLDLATANEGFPSALPNVRVLLGNGDGTFVPGASVPTAGIPKSVAVGDFNADGHLDLGVTAGLTDVGYYAWVEVGVGDGEGHFAPSNLIEDSFADGIFGSAAAADLNGDGADDLVVGDTRGGGVYVLHGGPTPGILQRAAVLNTGGSVTDVAVGDLNGDGAADIVAANEIRSVGGHGISVVLGDGLGGYAVPQGYALHESAYSVALGDFTVDGRVDVAWDGVRMLHGMGDGTLYSAPQLLRPGEFGAAGDFNEDGWPDLVGRSLDTIIVQVNDGTWGQVHLSPLPGDFDDDEDVDGLDFLVWQRGASPAPLAAADLADWKSNIGASATLWVSVDNVTKSEGAVGAMTLFTFTVTLSAASDQPVTMSYRTSHGSAGSGEFYEDYIHHTGAVACGRRVDQYDHD